MIRSIALFAAVISAGSSAALAQPGSNYRAVGTAPAWSVTIMPRTMRFEGEDGQVVSIATPRPGLPRYMGRIYGTPQLRVSIRTAPCRDYTLDRTYADTVDVTVRGHALRGCGGTYVDRISIAYTYWRITSINGRSVPGDGLYRLDFTGDRLSGQVGCNSFGGNYRIAGHRLTPGPIMATRMACLGGSAMRDERAVLSILRGPVTIDHLRQDVLELRSPVGSISLRMVPGPRPRG